MGDFCYLRGDAPLTFSAYLDYESCFATFSLGVLASMFYCSQTKDFSLNSRLSLFFYDSFFIY
jgi:hypothetical protein